MTQPPAPTEEQFHSSLPGSYANAFSPEERAEHFRWVRDRAAGEVRARVASQPTPGLLVLQVAADDRPSLIADWTAAFLAARLNLQAALIFTRTRPFQCAEAFDFFWVSAPPEHLSERAGQWLQRVASGEGAPEPVGAGVLVAPSRDGSGSPGPDPRVEVRRLAAFPGRIEVAVQVLDQEGLARAVASWAKARGLNVLAANLQTLPGGYVDDRMTLEGGSERRWSDIELEELRTSLLEVIRGQEGRQQN